MNIKSLRELIQYLEHEIDYCPPDNATDTQFERAIERADRAGKRLEDLGPIVALLEELERLSEMTTCVGCGQPVAWTCPHCGIGNAGAPNSQLGDDWDLDAQLEREAKWKAEAIEEDKARAEYEMMMERLEENHHV